MIAVRDQSPKILASSLNTLDIIIEFDYNYSEPRGRFVATLASFPVLIRRWRPSYLTYKERDNEWRKRNLAARKATGLANLSPFSSPFPLQDISFVQAGLARLPTDLPAIAGKSLDVFAQVVAALAAALNGDTAYLCR